ncbi:phenylalanine--tRNA ligase subunit beta [Anaerobranca gottschalkii]|uniref:Phenylalanine--tRNA ligase beta subunit n=1 Tax=Anaerobranca gottschalkii DSM 13577 TaxID=1120990 RepID=A0A1H9Z623_9FIRM|nr:phenylalanine--tRNA ligase subunit beta [Anaerobranca gottschalkii]SES76317.1 phenylalanyl-tRNA synthetase beta subunit [Anaerobranca gottschalkii DSM 13577]
MKISYNWLKEYVKIDLSPEELAEKLTKAGVVVEHISPAFEEIKGVVVAEILEIEKHPDADKLSVTKVNNGSEVLQVVCGANNIKVGQKVPLAQIGTVLPGNFKIKKSKIRGVESFGMLCSADELGLELDVEDGILILPEDTPLGLEISEVLGLNDYILLLDLTPNRSDCLSLLGVAKEVAALTGAEFVAPAIYDGKINPSSFSIKIESPECRNYIGGEISNIHIAPSPLWLQVKLLKAGLRPINNVVDITNYVMLEYGQPLHAFDRKKISTSEIVVKNITEEREFKTLDEQIRKIPKGLLVITDGVNPLAVAGVMGGAESEVDSTTEEIILESAYFQGEAVRRSVKGMNLRTEASSRFEKSVAPLYVKDAALRTIKLLIDLCGANLVGLSEEGDFSYQPVSIKISPQKVKDYLGLTIEREEIVKILSNLGCNVEGKDPLIVQPPHHRVDLSLEVDLIEEVARIYGYDNIPATLPQGVTTVGKIPYKEKVYTKIKDLLIGYGVNEVITYPFISPDSFVKCNLEPEQAIPLANPLGKENSLMRTSLLPSALSCVTFNLNRHNERVQFFELGKVYLGKLPLEKLPEERDSLIVILQGESKRVHWLTGKERVNDFYTIKGILESIFALCNIISWEIRKEENVNYHPGRSGAIYIQGEKVGFIGQLHPALMKNWEIEDEIYSLKLDLNSVVKHSNEYYNYKSIVKYPVVERDLAVVVDADLPGDQLIKEIKGISPIISKAEIFDVYQGKGIEEGKKSIAISITLQKNGTLTDEEINFFINKGLQTLEEKYNAKLRS